MAAFALLFISTSQAENVISLNFESWGTIEDSATITAGVVDAGHWNDSWRDGGGNSPMLDLRDSTGAATTTDVSYVTGVWGIRQWDGTSAGVDADGRRNVSLMKGYLDKHAPTLTSATFTEIPYASYNVYVYVMADEANRTGNVTDGTTTYHFLTDPSSVHFTAAGTADYVEFKEITATDAAGAVLSNYAVFKGLTGDTLTISCSVTSGGGIAGIQIVEDAFRPTVTPDNGDGTFGTLISQWEGQVTFGWTALRDPNSTYPVDPAILGHYIYLSSGDSETPELLDYVAQVHNADPYLTDPSNSYGPVTVDQGKTYYWKIEEALDDGTGNPNGDGDPNNIMGPVWSFKAVAAVPQILSGPEHALVDSSRNASMTVTTGAVATDFRWFKVGDPDVLLTDGGLYSGTQTKTLQITGATETDEGGFYCVAYNGDPDEGGIPSEPSKIARLWYPRLVSHYPFETIGEGNVTPDIVSGLDAVLSQESDLVGLPTLNDANAIEGSYSLQLDNADHAADPNGQFAQVPAGAVAYRDITISLWVRPDGTPGWSRVLDFGNGTTDYLFLTADAGWGVMRFAIRTPSVNEQLLEAGALADAEWSHVAVTLSGNTGKLYRNGELVATNNAMTLNPIDVNAVLNYIGKSQYPDPEFNGLIDDLKIYNYALSTVDVAQEFLAVSGGSVCNREGSANMRFDKNGDCKVNLVDFAEFSADWMNDNRVYPQ